MTHRAARWLAFPRVPTLDRSVLGWNSPMVCRRCQSCWQGLLRADRSGATWRATLVFAAATGVLVAAVLRDGGGRAEAGSLTRAAGWGAHDLHTICTDDASVAVSLQTCGGAPPVPPTLRLNSRPIGNLTEIGDTYGPFDTTRTWCSERTRT